LKINFSGKHMVLLFVAGFVVLIDQITKEVVLRKLPLYDSVTVVTGFFSFTNIRNPGGAFGLMANQPPFVRVFFFIFVSALFIIMIYFFYLKIPTGYFKLRTGIAMIFGGAVGNMVDRIRFGYVVDFLDFYLKNLHWPAFNIADSAITVGVTIFAYHLIFDKMPE